MSFKKSPSDNSSCSVREFLKFIENDAALKSCSVVNNVNLLRLSLLLNNGNDGSGEKNRQRQGCPRVALVMDAESALDRLYGGYFSDWSCGGQWRNMIEFLGSLIYALHHSNVLLAVYFNGALEPKKFHEWVKNQKKIRSNIVQVFAHLEKRATPPPKAWWVPPTAIQTMLRLGLRMLNNTVLNSFDDHGHEIMGFCWENGYHGVLAEDSSFVMFNPPRLFSAHSIKLSFQHDEVKATEFLLLEVAKSLDLNPKRFCLLGALLGSHILPTSELTQFYQRLAPEPNKQQHQQKQTRTERIIRAVINYVRALQNIEDFQVIGRDVFGNPSDPKVEKLKEAMQYFFDGSREGYTKSKPIIGGGATPSVGGGGGGKGKKIIEGIKFASDSKKELKKNNNKKKSDNDLVERIALDFDKLDLSEAVTAAEAMIQDVVESGDHAAASTASPRASSRAAAAAEEDVSSVVTALASGVPVTPSADGKYPSEEEESEEDEEASKVIRLLPISNEVRRTAADRHRLGQMSPYIYHILNHGEIKLPVLLERSSEADVPPIHELYRPLRQSVYAILFNLHHHRYNRRQNEEHIKSLRRKAEELRKKAKSSSDEKEKKELTEKAENLTKQAKKETKPKPEIWVREWSPYNDYKKPEMVEGVEIPWAVPTVQRLWFGSSEDDRQKRLRAFLTCMRCDQVKSLLSPFNVPSHMLLMACVLRYIMATPCYPVLRKPELDAFLATAFSPELLDTRYLAQMKLDMITPRGVQLATLFMEGIEMALMANDACGAPLPFQTTLPWTFFDGKLFHSKLRKATVARNLMELCYGSFDIVAQVERMRTAILAGLVPQYAAPSFGRPQRPAVVARGGQLVVGGAVVGQWGANFGSASTTTINHRTTTSKHNKRGNKKSKSGGGGGGGSNKKSENRKNVTGSSSSENTGSGKGEEEEEEEEEVKKEAGDGGEGGGDENVVILPSL